MTTCAYCGLEVEERGGEWTHAVSGRATCYAQHGITGPRATPATPAKSGVTYRPDCPVCRAKTKAPQ